MKRFVLALFLIGNFLLTQGQPRVFDLHSVDQKLFISTNTNAGYQLWKKEDQCFFLLKEFPYSECTGFIEWKGNLYFSNDGKEDFSGLELWRSDGTPEGTHIIKDINKKGTGNSGARYVTVVNDNLFFSAYDGTVRGLWKTDGTEAGTTIVKDQMSWSSTSANALTELTEVNGKLFFCFYASGTNQTELWSTDGTASGTVKIKAFPGGEGRIRNLIDGNGILYFCAMESQTGYELWKSDGTTSGTVLVKDIYPGTSNGFPGELIYIDNTLYFAATDPTNGRELWKSDGTAQGTVIYKDIVAGAEGSTPINLLEAFGDLFFVTWKLNDSNAPLWKVDLSSNSLSMLYNFATDPNLSTEENSIPVDFTQLDDKLFFVATDGLTGNELWVTDGSPAGTRQVYDFNPGPNRGYVYYSTRAGDQVFFSAASGNGSTSLWQVDGSLVPEKLTLAEGAPCQVIDLTKIPDKTLGDPPFTVSATSSSGLPVSFTSTSDNIALNGTTITLLKAGHATITAEQSGDANFDPANPVSQTFCINPAAPVISIINDSGIKLKSSSDAGNQWYFEGSPINETGVTVSQLQEGDYSVKVSIDGCTSVFSNIINTAVLSAENGDVQDYELYPNPVNDVMHIKGQIRIIRVCDSMGAEVSIPTEKLDGDGGLLQLNVRSLASGQYYLQYMANGAVRSLRFIKK